MKLTLLIYALSILYQEELKKGKKNVEVPDE